MEETWKPIKGFYTSIGTPLYEVSSYGRIVRIAHDYKHPRGWLIHEKETLMQTFKKSDDMYVILKGLGSVRGKEYKVNDLVKEAF